MKGQNETPRAGIALRIGDRTLFAKDSANNLVALKGLPRGRWKQVEMGSITGLLKKKATVIYQI
jgi:hypothetical protein